jgi:hypothetical protein
MGWESEGGCWGEDCIGLRIMEYVHMAGKGWLFAFGSGIPWSSSSYH